jgi:hypothetical protein
MGFDLAPYSGAISSVSDLVSGVVKRIWPEKAAEIDKLKLAAATAEFLATQEGQASLNEFADRASARALAAADVAKGNWFTNILAATVRPVFGYVAMAAFFIPLAVRLTAAFLGHAFTDAQLASISMNSIEREVVLSVVYFYMGGRTVEKGLAIWKGK